MLTITNFNCKKCKIMVEAWKGDQIKCKCGKTMEESKYGKRSHGGGHDFRFKDK